MNEKEGSAGLREQMQANGPTLSLTEASTNSISKGQVNWAYQHDTTMQDSDSDTGCPGDGSVNQVSHHNDEEKGWACGSHTHSIILDLSTASFVDTVAVNTLKNVSMLTMATWTTLRFIFQVFFKEDLNKVLLISLQIFRDFGEIDLEIYLAGCQGEWHTRQKQRQS